MVDDQQIKDNIIKAEAASKISNELKKLRNSSPENQERFRKRWVWELIQNATDCCRINETVDIEVDFCENSLLTFSHNGKGFNKENLWSIVTQFSSKTCEEDSTGKFGTGFISTTLISPNIIIDSFLEDTKQGFSLNLDRSSDNVEVLSQSIDNNMRMIESIEDGSKNLSHISQTKFSYDLANLTDVEKSVNAINDGINSLESHICYLLGFNEKISSIKCNEKKYVAENRRVCTAIPNSRLVDVTEEISQTKNTLIIVDFENGSIAASLYEEQGRLKFSKIDSNISRLFCDFPLIGTENYPFPIILNSRDFSVEIDRDGIFESDIKNTEIIENSIQAYESLLQLFSTDSQAKIFNICRFERNQATDYKRDLSQQIDNIIFSKNIVMTNNNKMISILGSDGNKQVLVPKEKIEGFEDRFYNLLSEIPSMNIPAQEFVEEWRDIINNDINVNDINNTCLKGSTIENFKLLFGSNEVIKWLNNYYQYVESLGNNQLFSNLVIPNSEGAFHDLKNIILVDSVIPNLWDIYLLIYPGLKNKMIYNGLSVPDKLRASIPCYTNEMIAREVENHIHALLSKEKKDNRTQETENIFSQTLSLFSQKAYDWNTLFPTLYPDRSKLRSSQFNEGLNQLGDTLAEKNIAVESISSLIADDRLLNILLTSSVELPEDVIQQLQHISKNSFNLKQWVDGLIKRSIVNVYNELVKNPRYEVSSTFEEWNAGKMSTTVFKAKKDGKDDLFIVIRPSDQDKVLFYEEEEFSALDSNNYELWTDNGEQVRQLTLGDILRTTNITAIPLRNLFV